MRRIPEPPLLTCKRCAGARFVPLTFPTIERVDRLVRPTAKCVTCGLRYRDDEPEARVG